MVSSRRHHTRRLLAAWVLYWTALAAVALARPGLMLWRLTRGDKSGMTAAVNFGDGALKASIAYQGATVWDATVGAWTFLLWVVVPPLVLWVLWAAFRPSATVPTPHPPELGPARPDWRSPAEPVGQQELRTRDPAR